MKMKKIILTIVALSAYGFANAQDLKYGVRGGLDMVSVSAGGGSESLTGFFAGAFAEYSLSDKIVLQPGFSYHTASKDGIKADYICIPALAKYKVADKINAIAGLAFFYDMDSAVKTDKLRFNLEIGGSYDITENIFIDPRYSLGLNGEAKVNHLLLGIGYKF
jgi:opacity protein-like surface antigen